MEENNESEEKVEIVTGAFIIHDSRILLATGPKFHNKWTVPGGHVFYRETSRQCVEREAEEEINCTVKAVKLFSVQERVHHTVAGRDRHFIFLNWKCEIVSGEPKIDGREFTEMTWMPVKQAMQDEKVMESVRTSLTEFVEDNR